MAVQIPPVPVQRASTLSRTLEPQPERLARRPRASPGSLADLAQRLPRNVGASIGAIILVLVLVLALLGDVIRPYDPIAIQIVDKFQPPSPAHLMGTDDLGRDIFSRVVEGVRISLRIVVLVLVIAAGLGTVAGLLAGYIGGALDEIVMRLADVFLAFPSFLLAMAIVAALGSGIENSILAIGISWWPRYARLLRGQVLGVRHDLYVEAARALGAGPWRLMRLHILPNARAPLLVQLASDAGQVIIVTASLSFVGLGAAPPTPEWGAMVAQARTFMLSYPWVGTFPGLAITVTVAGFVFLGDGLRDLFDPKLRGKLP